jgi:hypothetical protein
MVSFNLMPSVTRKTEIENSQQKLQAFCDAKKWRISLQTIFFTKKLLSKHVNQVGQKVAHIAFGKVS